MCIKLDYNGNKGFRLLSIYERLNKGELLEKLSLAHEFNVTPKTIQRDIDDLRVYLAETHYFETDTFIKYDKKRKGYQLVRFEREWITNEEVLALCKILLESRAFEKSEMCGLIYKILAQATPADRKIVDEIIRNEYVNYIAPRHNKKLLSAIWNLSAYITNKEIIAMQYTRLDGTIRNHKIKPVATMFSEFYFYLISFMADDRKEFPTIFRIDRIADIVGTKEKFVIPYNNRFSSSEFRKRVQFMYSGELKQVFFEYIGPSIEAVLDRLPTARIISETGGVYTIKAETYGNGVLMWLKSQGDWVLNIRFAEHSYQQK